MCFVVVQQHSYKCTAAVKLAPFVQHCYLFASSVSTFLHPKQYVLFIEKYKKKTIIMASGTIDEYEFSVEIDIPEEILTQHDINGQNSVLLLSDNEQQIDSNETNNSQIDSEMSNDSDNDSDHYKVTIDEQETVDNLPNYPIDNLHFDVNERHFGRLDTGRHRFRLMLWFISVITFHYY